MSSARFWLCGVITVVIALLRDYGWRAHVRLHKPSEVVKRQASAYLGASCASCHYGATLVCDTLFQVLEKRLAKAKGAVAKLMEDYKLKKETMYRETMIIRSGFAFDAPSARPMGVAGDGSARVRCAFTNTRAAIRTPKTPENSGV